MVCVRLNWECGYFGYVSLCVCVCVAVCVVVLCEVWLGMLACV